MADVANDPINFHSAQSSHAPVSRFHHRKYLAGWLGSVVDTLGRDNLLHLHEGYGPLPDFDRPKEGYRSRLRNLLADNLKSGITVAFVSIPVAISVAISAFATPGMGLASAFWGGLMASLFGGSQYNIVGPNASSSSMLAMYSLRYGYEILPLVSILAGLMLLAALIFRLDRYMSLFPGAVMHGFTLGAAILLAGNQLAFIFDQNNLPRYEEFYLNVYASLSHLGSASLGSFILFVIATVLLIALSKKMPDKPWVVVVTLVGIFIGLLSENGMWLNTLTTLNGRFPNMSFHFFSTPTLQAQDFTGEVIAASFNLAVCSLLETILAAKVADNITGTRFARPLEVFGLGIANLVAGVFNGLPVTGAISRTNLNVQSGATSRVSAFLQAVFVAIIGFVFLTIIGYLPLCIIAAILWNVAIGMVNIDELAHLWIYDKTMFGVMAFTALATVFINPAQGIIYGAVVSIFLHGGRSAEGWAEITVANGFSTVASFTSLELDRQAVTDSFHRQFPPTLKGKEEHQSVEQSVAMEEGRRMDAAVELESNGIDSHETPIWDTYPDNVIRITTPDINGRQLRIQLPGEISYLNAAAHRDRLVPFLGSGQYFVFELRKTYFLDVDGMDALSSIIEDVERIGKLFLIAGVTAQILPLLEQQPWFIKARNEGRIVKDYEASIQRIADLEREQSRYAEESDFQDFTRQQLDEIARHKSILARISTESAQKEAQARAEAEASARESAKREHDEANSAAIQAASMESHKQQILNRKRQETEEFERRLKEFEERKVANEAARKAFLDASSTSNILGEPSLTVPHHHDHSIPPKPSHSQMLPIQQELELETINEAASVPAPTPAEATNTVKSNVNPDTTATVPGPESDQEHPIATDKPHPADLPHEASSQAEHIPVLESTPLSDQKSETIHTVVEITPPAHQDTDVAHVTIEEPLVEFQRSPSPPAPEVPRLLVEEHHLTVGEDEDIIHPIGAEQPVPIPIPELTEISMSPAPVPEEQVSLDLDYIPAESHSHSSPTPEQFHDQPEERKHVPMATAHIVHEQPEEHNDTTMAPPVHEQPEEYKDITIAQVPIQEEPATPSPAAVDPSSIPTHPETHDAPPASVSFDDPFSGFFDATSVQGAPDHDCQAAPPSPNQQNIPPALSVIDFIDPLSEISTDSPSSSHQNAPETPQHSGGTQQSADDFDPFADILKGTEPTDKDDDEGIM